MASNLETFSSPETGKLDFTSPTHTSSPKSADPLLTLNELNKTKTNATGGLSSSSLMNKKDNGSRTSPSKPKYNLMTKKTSKPLLQNKNPDEIYNELIELKKAHSILGDENAALKNKLRRSEEEQTKRNEIEKTSSNMLVNNLKRKVQRLEETLKEKDNNLKKLQAETRMAKHEAKIAIDTNRQDSVTKRGMTVQKETSKLQKGLSRSPGSRSAESRSPTKSLLLVDEIKQLREKLRRALSIHDTKVIENYKNLDSDELIAEILRLKEEVEVLQKIKKKITEENQNGVSDLREIELLGEIDMLNTNIQHLKKERLSYFEESEKKDLELKTLKEELEQGRKDLGKNRPMYGAIQKVPSLSYNIEARNKLRPKPEVVKKSSTVVTSSLEANKRTLITSKPRTTSVSTTSKSSTTSAVTGSTAAKSKQKKTKEGLSPVRNGHSPISAAASKNASPKQSPKERKDVEKFRQNVAAKKIQQSWKSHRSDVVENGNENIIDVKAIDFKGNGNHVSDVDTSRDLQEAVTTIQSVARGNEVRSEIFNETLTKENVKDVDDSVTTTIQSVARAHHHREEILKTWETNGDEIVRPSASAPTPAAVAMDGLKNETDE